MGLRFLALVLITHGRQSSFKASAVAPQGGSHGFDGGFLGCVDGGIVQAQHLRWIEHPHHSALRNHHMVGSQGLQAQHVRTQQIT